jgi:hypothetical protein
VRSYRAIIERYIKEFGDGPVDQVTPEHILTFLNRLTEGNKPYTTALALEVQILPHPHVFKNEALNKALAENEHATRIARLDTDPTMDQPPGRDQIQDL